MNSTMNLTCTRQQQAETIVRDLLALAAATQPQPKE